MDSMMDRFWQHRTRIDLLLTGCERTGMKRFFGSTSFWLGLALSVGQLRAAEVLWDFASDPGWDGHRNHELPNPLPITRQNFGWSGTQHAGGKAAGEIGGWIQRSITPAWYARAIPTRTLDHKLSASGTFAVTKDNGGSGTIVGWFNDKARGWRTPNSLVFRLDGNGGKYWVLFEYGTRSWLTGGGATFEGRYQTTKTKPFLADGTVHRWSLDYDPKGAAGNGLITFVLDGTSHTQALAPGHKVDGAEFNRFGVFNQQLTGDGMEVYFGDWTLDGQPMDLTNEPGWEAHGNRTEFRDRDRRPFHDFGWKPTHTAGKGAGEIGGIIWRDVKPAYYGAKTKPLTLDHRLSASGVIAFHRAGSDSGVCFGWFDSRAKGHTPAVEGHQNARSVLAIAIEGPSRVGHYFRPEYWSATGAGNSAKEGPLIRPDGTKHRWALEYEPKGDGGEMRVTFDGKIQTLAISPEHRRMGASFDRFGIFNIQTGGHFVDLALDDLSFTIEP
jgi:hypothetical protein